MQLIHLYGGGMRMDRVLRTHDEFQNIGEYSSSLGKEAGAAFDQSIGHLVHVMRLLAAEVESVRDAWLPPLDRWCLAREERQVWDDWLMPMWNVWGKVVGPSLPREVINIGDVRIGPIQAETYPTRLPKRPVDLSRHPTHIRVNLPEVDIGSECWLIVGAVEASSGILYVLRA